MRACYLNTGHVQIPSFTVELPSDMTVYPQKYSLHCTKTGYPFGYDFLLNFDGIELIEVKKATDCTPFSHCDRQLIHNSNNTYDHIVNMTWDTVTITSRSFSRAYTGDQHYQCILYVIGHVNRTRDVTLKGKSVTIFRIFIILIHSSRFCSHFS